MSRIHENFRKHELPMAGVLNNPHIRQNRSLNYKGIRLHVSDLIKFNPDDKFCIREHTIKHLLKPTITSGVLSASFDLLFDLGNCLHDNARNRWMRYDKSGRKRVLARWSCLCGDVKFSGVNPEAEEACPRCLHKPVVFDEYEFANKELGIIAHPDFLLIRGTRVLKRGYFDKKTDKVHVVEIKGIDRADLDWDTIDGALGEHTLQGSCYYWLGRMAGYNMFEGISYLYGDRACKKSLFRGTPWKEFVLPPEPYERVNRVFQKARDVISGVEARVVPERTVCSNSECTRAKNCALAGICFSLPTREFEVPDVRKAKSKNSNKRKEPTAPVIGLPKDSHRVRPKPNRNRSSGT